MPEAKKIVNQPAKISWEALTYFNFYRFLISFLFVSLYWIGQLPEPLGEYDRRLFGIAAHIYLLVSVCAQLIVRLKAPTYVLQVAVNVFLDIIIITVMMYASAGLNSGFGMLLVISVAGGSLLSSGRIGILYASVATILVLVHEAYIQLQQIGVIPNYTHAGFLGITFFATASISHALAKRVEVSEALAEERAIDLENLAILNEHIVQRLQAGVIVLDDNYRIILVNESAKQLLEITDNTQTKMLVDKSQALYQETQKWIKGNGKQSVTLKLGQANIETQASFTRLKLEKRFGMLIFLEDVSTMRQRAQQMKLASLGRLTASIAHEIRNPLGAISHASQLLYEADSIVDEERRLTTIIDEQSKRVNNIIENVMSISRRQQSTPSNIKLAEWLDNFRLEFLERHKLGGEEMILNVEESDSQANMDPDQLYQIMWNLCENGIRYSQKSPLIEIHCRRIPETQRSYIDVVDHGNGMTEEVAEQLFEPFFTTRVKGSGLGLYIARELCEANQATLTLYRNSEDGCCFRVYFSHHEKQHNVN